MPRTTTRTLPKRGTAWLYLRVSTSRQANKDGEPDGLSIPAQRAADQRKADELNAVVTEEFKDPGYSARTLNRPDLKRLLERLHVDPPEYLIVHKVDRLARGRYVDVEINMALRRAGTKLVSVSENIDETPSGQLVHGIMSDIAEFYSANLAMEVTKGLQQKAQNGGTIGRAPAGYINLRETINGIERRYVELDPERARLMRWAFEQYATGEWTLISLTAELERRGLTTLPSPKHPSRPMTRSHLWKLLTNRYYLGKIIYAGVEYEGQHEPLISEPRSTDGEAC